MKTYQVEFVKYTNLETMEVNAEDKNEAVQKAFMLLHKYDRESYDVALINELEEDGTMIETEKVEKVVNEDEA